MIVDAVNVFHSSSELLVMWKVEEEEEMSAFSQVEEGHV